MGPSAVPSPHLFLRDSVSPDTWVSITATWSVDEPYSLGLYIVLDWCLNHHQYPAVGAVLVWRGWGGALNIWNGGSKVSEEWEWNTYGICVGNCVSVPKCLTMVQGVEDWSGGGSHKAGKPDLIGLNNLSLNYLSHNIRHKIAPLNIYREP